MATKMDQQETKLDKPKTSDNGEIKDAELDQVTGGTLGSTFSNVLKSIGEGLSSMARKG